MQREPFSIHSEPMFSATDAKQSDDKLCTKPIFYVHGDIPTHPINNIPYYIIYCWEISVDTSCKNDILFVSGNIRIKLFFLRVDSVRGGARQHTPCYVGTHCFPLNSFMTSIFYIRFDLDLTLCCASRYCHSIYNTLVRNDTNVI